MKRIVIVGGGAAGMAAAIAAAEQKPRAEVRVLERLSAPGKKLLATGNGRCNLTNLRASPAQYQTSSPEALAQILAGMTPEGVLAFFQELGLWCAEEEEGRVYPRSRQAASVLAVLQLAMERRGVLVECERAVTGLFRNGAEFFLRCADGSEYRADAVILTSGGRAAGKLGSDGSGYRLAKAMGHHWAPLYPALTPLKCDMTRCGSLKGIRSEGSVALLANGALLGRETGEVQFTEYGLSGIPVMQLSGLLGQIPPGQTLGAEVDLFPELPEAALLRELQERRHRLMGESCRTLLLGLLHDRLAAAALRCVNTREDTPIRALPEEKVEALSRLLKCWPFPVLGPLGYDSAQVSGGGILLEEVWPETMGSRLQPGLYFAGELLDAAGSCGGFNLHWAWCTGIRAGRSAALGK